MAVATVVAMVAAQAPWALAQRDEAPSGEPGHPAVAATAESAASDGVVRVGGADRFATAALLAERVGADGEAWASTGFAFADALAAGSTGRGPMVLTVPPSTPEPTLDAAGRLGADTLLAAGGPGALPQSLVDEVAAAMGGQDRRLAGPTRWATAAAIADDTFPDGVDTVWLATGDDFPDGLAAGAAAAVAGDALLLTARDTLPGATAEALARLDPEQVRAVGGTAAITSRVLAEAGEAAGGAEVRRVAGEHRFATAAALAQRAFPDGAATVYLATGGDWPDAMTASAAAAREDAALLLNASDELLGDTRAELERLEPSQIVVVGGTAAIPNSVMRQAGELVVAGPDEPPPDEELGSISGTVTNAEDTPIEQARVALDDTELEATTDQAGDYTITEVPAGSYDVTAQADDVDPVTTSGVAVAPGEAVAGVDFALELAAGAERVTDEYAELDESQRAALQAYDPDSGELRFAEAAADLDIAVGDVLASVPTDAAPNGLLVEVTDVTDDGDVTTIDSEFAQLTDAIVHGQGAVSVDLSAADVAGVETHVEGLTVRRASQTRSGTTAASARVLELAFEETPIDGVTVSGETAIDLGLDSEVEFSWGTLDHFELVVDADQSGHLDATAGAAADWSKSVDLVTVDLAPVTFPVGPVPVTLRPELGLTLGASGEIEAGIETHVEAGFSTDLGVTYTDGDLAPVYAQTKEFNYSEPTIYGDSEAEVGLTPSVGVRIYETAGSAFEATGYGRAEAHYPDPPAWAVYAGLRGAVVFDLEFPVLGTIGEVSQDVFELEWLLAEAGADEDPQPPPDSGPTELIVTVTDNDTGQPVQGATVTVDDRNDLTATTNVDGEASWSDEDADVDLPTGDVTIAVAADGYDDTSTTATIVADQSNSVAITLGADDVPDIDGPLFVTTWDTSLIDGTEITLPFHGDVDVDIAWGDDTTDQGITGQASHTYDDNGTYTVTVGGTFQGYGTDEFSPDQYSTNPALLSVDEWEDTATTSLRSAFEGGLNLSQIAEPPPTVIDMSRMLRDSESFNQAIGDWDVSNVTDMSSMFGFANSFNRPIGNWDVGNVTTMRGMFEGAHLFDQPIEGWDVSNVSNMRGMFELARTFNQPIGDWDVSNVTDMVGTFSDARAFNQPISDWDVSNVTNMRFMFVEARAFDQPIGNWNTSSVVNMSWMFNDARNFNQNLSGWNVSNVENYTGYDVGADSWAEAYKPQFE